VHLGEVGEGLAIGLMLAPIPQASMAFLFWEVRARRTWYCPEMPEWSMEKYRFYLDLPGDFWERGTLLRYLRSRDVPVVWDAGAGQYLLPHAGFSTLLRCRTEVQLLDPATK
jgi:hypothetical protein